MTGQRPFDLGGWRVEPARGALTDANGAEKRLEPKLMDLLLLFAASPGRVIAKDEIVASVWQGRAIGDDTLAAALSRLRTALGETRDKRYIETLPKRGYRLLIAPDGAAPATAPSEDGVAALLRKGRAALAVPLPQSLAQARVYFEAAAAADGKSAAAQAGLAEVSLAQHAAGQGAAFAGAAKGAAQAAVALDPTFAEGWALLGIATLLAARDFAAADAALLKAAALNPKLTRVHRARGFALAAVARFVEAEREARRAAELEPFSLAARIDVIQILFAARRIAPALAEARKAIELSAQSADAWSALGWAHAFLGNHRDAADALLQSLRLLGTDAVTVARLRAAFDKEGFDALCSAGAKLLEQQRVMFVPRPMDLAMLHAQAGEPDAAFAALEESLARDEPTLLFLPYLPHLDRLRNDPRFATILTRARPVR